MLRSPIVRLVDLCARHAWPVIAIVFALSVFSGVYAVRHFAIRTDINDLFPPDLPWTARAFSYMHAFPQGDVIVVVDAPTAEYADVATARLAAALRADRTHIKAVDATQSDPFFAQNALLYLPMGQLQRMAGGMQQAAPLVGGLAADPSLRGVLGALSYGLMGVANGVYDLNDLARAMNMGSDTIEAALAGRPTHFSWQALLAGKPPDPSAPRRFIRVTPVRDFTALEPGRAATDAITAAAARLNLTGDYQARVRLTGLVPIDDAQFATLTQHVVRNGCIAIIAVVIILWLALRSWRISVAALISVACGLSMAAALGLWLVGALNLISVAFFVLFVGLGVDFGIQFAVRYRAERHDTGELHSALVNSAAKAGGPLALAAAATAIGFAAFVPTPYRGLGELGEIAGPGMLIAFATSVTLLPALLAVLKPPGEPHPMGFSALAPIDRFLQRRRFVVVGVTAAMVLAASPLLLYLPFDFDPIHLSSPKAAPVATFLELRRDPHTGANAIEIVAPNESVADATAARLAKLPEVARATTLTTFVPSDQDAKLALVRQTATALGGKLNPAKVEAPPNDQQIVESLLSTAISLQQFAAMKSGPGATASNRLFQLCLQLARAEPAARARVAAAMVTPLQISLMGLRQSLQAQPVTQATLPPDLRRNWQTPDGHARVEVLPKGDPDNTAVLRKFVAAVRAEDPGATGPAVLLYEAGGTIVLAFIEAGIFALVAIFVLLWIALRRITDVLLTLVPLMVAAVVTLELCVVLDLPLNFANIIALPLLFGVGVAFKIYYIMAWRRGRTALVQSTLSRAVIFSAMTTGTAFGSLWLSSHPGTSSMGELMGLALLCTMAAAVLFQPALMGPPRVVAADGPPPEAAIAPESAVASRTMPFTAAPSERWRVERRQAIRPAGRRSERDADERREEATASDEIER